MTYWSLNAFFLAAVLIVAVVAILTRRAPRWRAVGLATIVVLIMTVVFDNVLVGLGIVGYTPDRISGVLIGVAPLEDFSYAVAALVLLPCLWTLLGGPSRRDRFAGAPQEPELPEERRATRDASRRPGRARL